MHAVARPYVMASAALAATSLVAVTPITPRLPELPIVSQATRLIAGQDSLLNVPLNLFYDLVNIPANELHAIQFFTDNLFMAGPWFVVGPSNLWGVDPGDPTHFMSVVNFAVPFPALSGMDASELDFNAGLGQQLWGLAAAELPVSSGCDAVDCVPLVPTSPITGLTGIDSLLWPGAIATGQQGFPLFDHWLKVPFDQLNPYYFNPAFDGSTDPSGSVSSFTGWGLGGQSIPGTGPNDAMPWSGESYTLQPWVPVENFLNSLMAPPATDGIAGTGIDSIYTNPIEIAQTFQAFAAGLLMFDPFIPGSPFCPGDCSMITNAGLNYPQLIQDIGNAMPGNPVINEWLTAYANGTANVPSQALIQRSIELLQNAGLWDFQNPPYLGHNVGGSFDLGTLAPLFHQFWTDLGFNPPPLADPSAYPAAEAASTVTGGLLPNQLSADLSTLTTMLGTTSFSDFLSTLTTDLTTQLQADLSEILASFGAVLPADVASNLSADLLTLF